MREPLHWPPGAPVLFAVGYKFFGSEQDAKTYDIRSAYWEQAADHDRDDRARAPAGVDARRAVGGRARRGDRRHLPAADRRDRGPALRAARRVPAARRVRRARAGAQAPEAVVVRRRRGALRPDDPHPHRPAAGAVLDRRARRADRADPDAVVALADRARAAGRHGRGRARAVDDLRLPRGGPLHPGHEGQRGGAVRRHLPAGRRHDDRDEGAPRGRSCGPSTPSTTGSRPTRSRPPTRSSCSPPSTRTSRATTRSTGRPRRTSSTTRRRSRWRSRRCSGPRPSGCGSSTTAAAACTTSRRRCASGRSCSSWPPGSACSPA